MSLFKRKKKEKKPKNWYKISASLTVIAFLAAILVFNFFDMYDFFKDNTSSLGTTLNLMKDKVETDKLITNNSVQNNYTVSVNSLLTKIDDSGLDLLTQNELDKNKFKHSKQNLQTNFELTDQEFTIFATTFVPALTDGILIENFLEITITKNADNSFSMFTVAKLNLNKILEGIGEIKDFELYLTNNYNFTFENQTLKMIDSTCKLNNLSKEKSDELMNTLDELSAQFNVKLSTMTFHFVDLLISNFSYNTTTNVVLDNHKITFNLNTNN